MELFDLSMEREKIIVDCDAGTDDALALILLIEAHKSKRIEIMAITCVTGNTSVDNVVINVFRTLDVCSLNIPVFKGAHSPLIKKENDATIKFHGSDGFGDIFKDKPNINKLEKEHAVFAIQRIVSEYPGNVSIVCIGPLTNLALSIKLSPKFITDVKQFYIMGGIFNAKDYPVPDFNFNADPESVNIFFFNRNNKKVWLLPKDTCLKSRLALEWRQNVFGLIDTPCVKLLNAIEAKKYSAAKTLSLNYTPCDAILAGMILKPDMVRNIIPCSVDIELAGELRGRTIINESESNVFLIEEIDSEILKDVLLFAADPNKYARNLR